jgi:hypothetical protein
MKVQQGSTCHHNAKSTSLTKYFIFINECAEPEDGMIGCFGRKNLQQIILLI